MKKIRIIQFIGIGLFLVYFSMMLTDLILGLLGDYSILIMSMVLAAISMNLIAKGALIKSSSTLWFAIVLILYAIVLIVFEIIHIVPIDYYFIFSIIPIISSMINLFIFENLIYIKVIILNISIVIPLCIQYFVRPNIILMISLYIIFIILGIYICRHMNFRREKV